MTQLTEKDYAEWCKANGRPKPLRSCRVSWTKAERQAAWGVGVVCLFALVVAVLLHSGLGRV